ncbi:MAG: D-alanine--D-alanine ligase, partial [bacterium]
MKNYSRIKTIGIVFNLKRKNVSGDQHEEYDEIETIISLKSELSKYGFKVVLLEQNNHFLNRL